MHPSQVPTAKILKPPQMGMHTVAENLEWPAGGKLTEVVGSADVFAAMRASSANMVQ